MNPLTKGILSLLFLVLATGASYGQGEANNWLFNSQLHVDFNTAPPTVHPPLRTIGNGFHCALSDPNGNLLFWFDGDTVYDRNSNPMPNGVIFGYPNNAFNWWNISDRPKRSIAFEHPRKNGIYGIIGLKGDTSATGGWNSFGREMFYVEIDMNLRGGLGDVIHDSIIYTNASSTLLALTQHCNQRDLWVVTHKGKDSQDFLSFLITPSGFNGTPIVSSLGPKHNKTGWSWWSEYAGNIKFDLSGARLGAAIDKSLWNMTTPDSSAFLLMDFDNVTGQLTNAINIFPQLTNITGQYNSPYSYPVANDLAFSPDGSKFYGVVCKRYSSTWDTSRADTITGIHQWDVSTSNPTTIRNSHIQLVTDDTIPNDGLTPWGANFNNAGFDHIELAPNGIVYFSRWTFASTGGGWFNGLTKYNTSLGAILSPNSSGLASTLNFSEIQVRPYAYSQGPTAQHFPLFVSSYQGNNFINYKEVCVTDTAKFSISNPTCLLSAKWNFDDPASGANNTDTGTSVAHKFTAPGVYDVELIVTFSSHTDTIIQPITIYGYTKPLLGNDTLRCDGDTILIEDTSTGLGIIQWWDGVYSKSQRKVTSNGTFWIERQNECGTFRDSMTITKLDPPSIALRSDTTICNQDTLLIGDTAYLSTYRWNTNQTDSFIQISSSGTYELIATNLCGSDTDDVVLQTHTPITSKELGNDTMICQGVTYPIILKTPAYSYLWDNGWTIGTNIIKGPGTYWVRITNACGTFTDTLKVDSLNPPVASLGNDTIICKNGILILDATYPLSSYNWRPGNNGGPTYQVKDPGLYSVTVTNPCGSDSDSILISPLKAPDIDLGLDTAICPGDSILLSVSADGASYIWHNGKLDSSTFTKNYGNYWVRATNLCGSDSAGINITQLQPAKLNLTYSDTFLCDDNTLQVDVTQQKGVYYWGDGIRSAQRTISEEGIYRVTVSNACARDSGKISVEEYLTPQISLPNDSTLCDGENLTLTAYWPKVRYLWDNDSEIPKRIIQKTGIYWLKAENACGSSTDTTRITFDEFPTIDIPEKSFFCRGDRLTLSAKIEDSLASYYWEHNGSTSMEETFLEPGVYFVEAINNTGCSTRKKFVLDDSNCENLFFAPNTFTPNIDGINEGWKIYSEKTLKEFKLSIYNRWGDIVFQSNDQNASWDGVGYDNEPHASGVYVWSIQFKDLDNQTRKFEGPLYLLR